MRERIRSALIVTIAAMGLAFACSSSSVSAPASKDACPPKTYSIGDPVPCKRVAVMYLKVFGDYADQVALWLPALIEDRLLDAGWTLVVRGERMDHIQDERNLPGVKPGTEPPDREILGATAFLELTARVQVKEYRLFTGYSIFGGGSVAKASVDLSGQITDAATGVLKSSVIVRGSQSGVGSIILTGISSDWRVGTAAFDIPNILQTLTGKAGDKAVVKLVERLKEVYPVVPGGVSSPLQPIVPTVAGEPDGQIIVLNLPDGSNARPGDRYGIYRQDTQIAEVEIVSMDGSQAQARVISQTQPLSPTDKARKMPITIDAEGD